MRPATTNQGSRERADLRGEPGGGSENGHDDRPESVGPLSPKTAVADELFRLLVATVRDYAIFMLDPTGHVVTWNAGAERLKGYAADEIIGRHFSVFYPEVEVRGEKCDGELAGAAESGRFEDEGWRVRKDGSLFWANVVITAMRDRGGRLLGFAKVTRDLTDRKRAEDERAARLAAEQAQLAAERATRGKDEFLAVLGHELRNPLAPIATALQIIKLRGDTRSVREHEVIERQVQNMMHLVDDLLDVSRVGRGKLELKREVLDLRNAITRAVEIASPLLEHKNHQLALHVPGHPLSIDGDEARLTQVFSNLLTNAGKYTDRGGHIAVHARQVGDRVVVEVRDDGMGIDAGLLPRVFDLFVQGRQIDDRAAGGLGLGLALVRSLVQIHGGEVEAASPGPQQGSTFTVRLPAVSRPSPEDGDERAPNGLPAVASRRRILVVDDNEDARMLLADILGTLGHDVRDVGDGPEALQAIGEFTPDVAILDIGLPGMDGFELAEHLRAALPDAAGVNKLRLIAVSGYGQPADFARSAEAGFDRHLVKPVELRRLVDTIAELTT